VGTANTTTVNGVRISIDVQGNISAAEAAAIGDVVRQVETLAEQFFAGDVAQAFASAGALQIDSAQLASVALRMRYSTSFSAVGVATAPPAAAAPVVTPADASSPPAPAAPATPATGAAAASAASTPAAADSVAAAPAASTPASAAPPSIMSILQDFLKQVLDFALSSTGDQSVTASAHLRLKLLLTVTQTLAPAASAGSITGAGGTAAAPAATPAATAADPAAAVAKLGSVVDSIGSQLA
jgi:hypothetical protein